MRRSLIAIPAAAVLGIVTLAGTASAGPASGQTLTVTCPNGTFTVQAVGNGNGHWTPALDKASNAVYQPVAFLGSTITYTVNGGDEQTMVDPVTQVKNGNRNGVTTQQCSFVGHIGPFDDPDLGGTIVGTITGEVVVKVK